MDDFSWGTTRQVSKSPNLKSKSRDETVRSDSESPKGFEVVDSQVVDADEHDRAMRRAAGSRKGKHPAAGGTLKLKPKLHSSVPIDLDLASPDELSVTSNTLYDPSKYADGDEAKRARRMRRGEC